MSRLLRIDTNKRTFAFSDMGAYAGMGGRALTSRLILDEVPALSHPLGASNKLVAAAGILTGTAAANSGRISLGAKSPLTGGIKESNSGGLFSQKMAKLGIQAMVFEDKPEDSAAPVVVVVKADGVSIVEAPELAGLGTYAASEILLAKYGSRAAVMLIGPAGETCRLAASVQFTDPKGRPARAAGRGGLGAVMGSKKIKAVVVDDTGATGVPVADKEAFKAANKRWVEILGSHPVTSQGLPGFGTSILVNIINEAGALPTKNFRFGRFDQAADISGEKMVELMQARGGKPKEGCHPGCVIQCSQTFVDDKGGYLSSGLEYETVWAFGANCLINDIDDIARMDHACDDLGLDTIDMGNAVAVAMDGGIIPWGDSKAALTLLRRVGDPSDSLGRIMGNGAKFAGQAFGVSRVAEVKGQALPAYDPRSVKGVGVTYATTPMGADHTAGYAVCQNILKCGGDVNPMTKVGQVELSKNLQIATAAIDAVGFCLFVAFAVLDTADAVQVMCDQIAAVTGKAFAPGDFLALGVNTLKDEIAFNTKAGFTKEHDQLPEFFAEPLAPHNTTWDFTPEELQGAKVS
ncbi:aldehyde ferredoxin oxidoreductase [Desulfovibrio sulfodismutans]|uniref:Aldehyde ferredoxin oxidoreductase n=1 Tax=Desulfolutivibrio sulfodismutans TaxID=63561 RepID=A0A7K3NLA3_9BACT|nr:aldehyde ferredoxin oxidoreductase C-terminal domain-containing protein [Desulfolutivibrio sulfodismutans]NDY56974.1 aldehyde ferredoxin oxidoreductase [Desulfolutivibrio sulfodismutans]QLA12079.1 aldehyde ferredoxin oxidoreductase [Desulfolutivibrio sulfodismutans DSM 3696]